MSPRFLDFVHRCRHMLLGWGFVGLVYSLGAAWPAQPLLLHETAIDRLVPFDSGGIWVYLSFFVLVGGTFLSLPRERLPRFTRSFQIAALIAGVIFLLMPTRLVYPEVWSGHVSAALLRLLMQYDSAQNCLPSLHAALTLLCVVAQIDAARPIRSAWFAAWGVAMLHAILQTRRHLAIDIAAGLLVGIVALWLAARADAKREETQALLSPEVSS